MDRVGGRTPHDDCELKPNTQTDLTSLQAEDGVPPASATCETRKTRPRRPAQAKVTATMPSILNNAFFLDTRPLNHGIDANAGNLPIPPRAASLQRECHEFMRLSSLPQAAAKPTTTSRQRDK